MSDARGGAQAWAKLVRHGFGLAPASEGRPCQARLPRSAAGRGCDARAEHRDAARLAPLDEHNLALLAETAEALCAYADTRLLA